jgi:hypothetical protein
LLATRSEKAQKTYGRTAKCAPSSPSLLLTAINTTLLESMRLVAVAVGLARGRNCRQVFLEK